MILLLSFSQGNINFICVLSTLLTIVHCKDTCVSIGTTNTETEALFQIGVDRQSPEWELRASASTDSEKNWGADIGIKNNDVEIFIWGS